MITISEADSVAAAVRLLLDRGVGGLAVVDDEGHGRVIAMDREGRVAMPFNTPGMFRGTIDAAGNVTVEIYGK